MRSSVALALVALILITGCASRTSVPPAPTSPVPSAATTSEPSPVAPSVPPAATSPIPSDTATSELPAAATALPAATDLTLEGYRAAVEPLLAEIIVPAANVSSTVAKSENATNETLADLRQSREVFASVRDKVRSIYPPRKAADFHETVTNTINTFILALDRADWGATNRSAHSRREATRLAREGEQMFGTWPEKAKPLGISLAP